MQLIRRSLRNASLLFSSAVAMRGMGMLLVIVISRTLLAEGVGRYTYIIALTLLADALIDFGISSYSVQAYSQDFALSRTRFSSAVVLKGVLGILAAAGFSAFLFATVERQTALAGSMFLIGTFFSSFSTYLRIHFDARQDMLYQAVLDALRQLIIVGGGVVALLAGGGLVALGVIFAVASFLHLCAWAFVFSRHVEVEWTRPSWDVQETIMRRSLPFLGICLLGVLTHRLDPLILKFFVSDSDLGFFGAASLVISVSMYMSSALVNASFPVFSQVRDDQLLRQITSRMMQISLVCSALYALPLLLFPEIIMQLGFNFEDAIGGQILFVLAFTVLPLFLGNTANAALRGIGRERLSLLLLAMAVGVNLMADLLLIPRMGVLGACYGSLFGRTVYFISSVYFLRAYVQARSFIIALAQAAAVLFAVSLLRPLANEHLYLAACAVAVGLVIAGLIARRTLRSILSPETHP